MACPPQALVLFCPRRWPCSPPALVLFLPRRWPCPLRRWSCFCPALVCSCPGAGPVPAPALVLFRPRRWSCSAQALRFRPHPLLPDLLHAGARTSLQAPASLPSRFLTISCSVTGGPKLSLEAPREGPLFLLPEPDPHPWGTRSRPRTHGASSGNARTCRWSRRSGSAPGLLAAPVAKQSWSARLFSLSWIYCICYRDSLPLLGCFYS